MKNTKWIILAVVILLLGSIGINYNRLVTLDEQADAYWSQIDVQLQRRADLIPNLIATVKGYAAHEEEIFKAVADARSRLLNARGIENKAAANTEVTNALGRLLAISESYPTLKADANFRQLSDELAGTENRIAVARRDYNEAVKLYNTRIRRFPTSITAAILGFEKRDYFESKTGAENVPEVNFGS